MRFLREQLDDPGAEDCGRCDNCGALELPGDVSETALADAGERLRRPGVTLAPRKMWPTALANLGIDLKGKIAEPAEEGRAVGRLTDLGHGQTLRALFRPDAADGPVPRPLVDAVIEVLGDWHPSWPTRPTGIVYVESARRPQLTRDLAEGLARYLKLPDRRTLGHRRPRRRSRPGRRQLRPARGRGGASLRPRARPAARRRPRAPGRRPRGHRLDPHSRRARPCSPPARARSSR